MIPLEQEGVIKYRLAFKNQDIKLDRASLNQFNSTRRELIDLGLMGQDDARYDGYGFGNISLRCTETCEAFWISGTQTGHLANLDHKDLCLITQTFPSKNTVVAQGLTQPSSESMTHSVLYQVSPRIRAAIHVHSPDIWINAHQLGLPATPSHIPYGTPEMAESVSHLTKLIIESEWPIAFSMDGHEDGIVVAGKTLDDCTRSIVSLLHAAKSKT